MKRIPVTPLLLMVVIILSACGFPTAPVQPQPQPMLANNAAVAGGKLISSSGVEFFLPIELGTDAVASIVPEARAPQGSPSSGDHPAYLQFKLLGYPLAGTPLANEAEIRVYAANAPGIQVSTTRINAIIAAPAQPITKEALPPTFNGGGLILASNTKLMGFPGVFGVHMLAAYSQAVVPITSANLAYQFQGMNADGKYFVVINMPISAPGLDTVPMPQDATGYPAYLTEIANKLTAAETAGTLSPSLALLDGLGQSLKINSAVLALPTPLPTQAVACQDQAAFKGEEEPKDTDGFVPNQLLLKDWVIYNTGTCTWNTSYTWRFVSGEQMGAPASVPVTNGSVAPGQSVTVSINLTTPANYGFYRGYWRLVNSRGDTVPITGGENNSLYVHIIIAGGK